MQFPASIDGILTSVGQAAVEVPCMIDDYREFVTVFRIRTANVPRFMEKFPYYANMDVVYRIMRFRVDSHLIKSDHDFYGEDLAGLQEVYLPTQEAVLYLLDLWKVPVESLLPPSQTDVPV